MSLLKSHLWPACRLPYPHPRPQTSTNVSSNIAPLAALPSHPPPGPSPGPGHHDHPRLWLLGALSSQKVRLSLCSAAGCAKHIECEGRGTWPLTTIQRTAIQHLHSWPCGAPRGAPGSRVSPMACLPLLQIALGDLWLREMNTWRNRAKKVAR